MYEFKSLVKNINAIHNQLQKQAANSVNQALTIRNWLIGLYIVEYEQKGKERAEYGTMLVPKLAKELQDIKGFDTRSLHNFRLFYKTYPQIGTYLTDTKKVGSLTPLFENQQIVGLLTTHLSLAAKIDSNQKKVNGKFLLSKLSYTHFEQLIRIDNFQKRTFYEIESIKSTWSVRELKRQISSLYFERSGLSTNPEKLSAIVKQNSTPQNATDIIKNIYTFEFLNLKTKEVVEESDLETALLDHLQEFIIELGNGFCFEARQKRILIDEKYYFVDMVFYHRILKCHVLVELKIGEFEHGDIGQLNTYLNYYKEEISEKSDNAPVGILLVTDKNNTLVKYATAGMDENLFIQQYLVQLPSKEQLEKYIENELKTLV